MFNIVQQSMYNDISNIITYTYIFDWTWIFITLSLINVYDWRVCAIQPTTDGKGIINYWMVNNNTVCLSIF